MGNIKLLDCTLRDGGYINDWRFGEDEIPEMIEKLEQTKVDILELGFLKNEPYQKDRTVFNSMEQVKALLPEKKPGIAYAVMCEVVNPLPLDMLAPADEDSADIIRVIVWKTKHNADGIEVDALQEGYEYCKGIVEKGYRLCVQPARVSQYSDDEFVSMVKQFSKLSPMAIYVVDSWGTENAEGLLHYMHLADENMPAEIALGYHGHNNMMQALGVSQAMLKENFSRDMIIDASVYGIGRGAGNLNLEIIAKYLNEQYGKKYDLLCAEKVNSKYIQDIFRKEEWGYSELFFLTAKYNCNPNYARYIKKLGIDDYAEEILAYLPIEDKVIFSAERVDKAIYDIRKKEIGLAIVVPTCNRIEVVKHWIHVLGKDAYRLGCDIVFYDGSDERHKSDFKTFLRKESLPNIRIVDSSEKVQGVLCNKIYAASIMALKLDEYRYIWMIRDRSIPNLSTIWHHIESIAKNKNDFAVVYPHFIETKFYGNSLYTDCRKLLKDWCGEMTSLGSIIFSREILEELVSDYPVDSTNYGLWLPMALFHCIAYRPFQAYFFSDGTFNFLPYSGSFWIKNSTLLWLFAERWNEMIDELPEVYNDVKECVRQFEGWGIPPFSKALVMAARAAHDVSLKNIVKYRSELKRCAPQRIPMLICMSMIPANVVAYYLDNRNSLLIRAARPAVHLLKRVSKIVKAVFNSIRAPFVRKEEKEFTIDISKIPSCIDQNQQYKSYLLYGEECVNQKPLISIIVTTYQREEYLEDALNSVVMQEEVPFEWECIVVDNEPYDGKKNVSQKVVEHTNCSKIRYYRNQRNLSADGNMNRGATLARGKWISFLHDDDLLYPDFLKRIGVLIRGLSDRRVGLIFGHQNIVYYNNFAEDEVGKLQFYWNSYYNTTRTDRYQVFRVFDNYIVTGENSFNVPTCGCTYLREAYLEFDGHNEQRFGLVDDAYLACMVTKKYGAYMSLTPFGDYRWGSGTTAKKLDKIIEGHYKLRDYMYNQHWWSKILKKSLQMEHTKFSEEAFSNFDPVRAKDTCNELIVYVPNPLRRIFIRLLRKISHTAQRRSKMDLKDFDDAT